MMGDDDTHEYMPYIGPLVLTLDIPALASSDSVSCHNLDLLASVITLIFMYMPHRARWKVHTSKSVRKSLIIQSFLQISGLLWSVNLC